MIIAFHCMNSGVAACENDEKIFFYDVIIGEALKIGSATCCSKPCQGRFAFFVKKYS
jgi:hypothetical protein